MPYIDWTDDFSVGHPKLDEQHKKWVSIINQLHEAMKTGKGNDVLAEVLKNMQDYIAFHFSEEEKIMQSINFPQYFSHKKIHDQYASTISKIIDEYTSGKILISLSIMDSLKEWLMSHIMVQDKKYVEYL